MATVFDDKFLTAAEAGPIFRFKFVLPPTVGFERRDVVTLHGSIVEQWNRRTP